MTEETKINPEQYQEQIGPKTPYIINPEQYQEQIGPKTPYMGQKPVENVYAKSEHTSEQPFKTPNKREKIEAEGAQKAGIKDSYNKISETFNRGRDGKVLSEVLPAETAALQGLHKERAAALEAKADGKVIKAIEDKIADATRALEPKAKAFKELNVVQKAAASAGGNFGNGAGKFEKGIRGAGVVVGLGSIISGTKQLISPEVNENGERQGSIGKQLGKIAGGAALVYASALHGGANKAMGIRV